MLALLSRLLTTQSPKERRQAPGAWGAKPRGLPYRARAEPSHPEYPHPDRVERDVDRMHRAQVSRYWRFRQFTINRCSDRVQSGRQNCLAVEQLAVLAAATSAPGRLVAMGHA